MGAVNVLSEEWRRYLNLSDWYARAGLFYILEFFP